jgi:hypothetical protein
MIASVFITSQENMPSSIKFGSYDRRALECCDDLKMVRTRGLDTWSVDLKSVKMLNQ